VGQLRHVVEVNEDSPMLYKLTQSVFTGDEVFERDQVRTFIMRP
jgi:hypothetical protein